MNRAPSHVLVGGLGFVGYHLAMRLKKQGYRVTVIARRRSIQKRGDLFHELQSSGIEVVDAGDHINRELLIELDPLVIYHLAGKPGGSYKVQYESHVRLLDVEIEAALKTSARVVYTSSIAVAADIADKPAGSTITEEDAPPNREASFTTIHAETKAAGETILLESGLKKWSIIRPGLIFGPKSPHIEWRIMRALSKLHISLILEGIPVVNVKDVAEILYMAGQGCFDKQWIHAVADKIEFKDVVNEYCQLYGKDKCIKLPATIITKLGRVTPRSSPARLSWSLVRKRYRYRSARLKGFPWRLRPVED
ncbi:MAG: NAD(P)-dependent oxidoreductase [Desulfurococcales archaeon]|nr:NAD(P)-dependent oxidoreductase [Desulfurococcales archaeon]